MTFRPMPPPPVPSLSGNSEEDVRILWDWANEQHAWCARLALERKAERRNIPVYQFENRTEDRGTLDCNSTTVGELADVLATYIVDRGDGEDV